MENNYELRDPIIKCFVSIYNDALDLDDKSLIDLLRSSMLHGVCSCVGHILDDYLDDKLP